ncbi:MAG: NfeD family protein [Phycisphaerales bacterium]|jgi:membrane-bound serine protease (ClpP class)
MESLLVWGLGLIGLAILLLSLEFFFPAAGALALTSFVLAVVGIICLFRYDMVWGATGTLLLLVMGPTALYWGLKIWPHTALGRGVVGAPTEEELEAQRAAEASEQQKGQALIGKEGMVVSDLRPVGAAEIAGQRMEVISEGTFVPTGARVRVIAVNGVTVRVREVR